MEKNALIKPWRLFCLSRSLVFAFDSVKLKLKWESLNELLCTNKGINEVISLWRLIQAYVKTRGR